MPIIDSIDDKIQLHHSILTALESTYKIALDAAQQAYETATDNETKAENKYDTFSLEASYLAQGQSKRVEECLSHITIFIALDITLSNNDDEVAIGQLVLLEDEQESPQFYFISPIAGGLKLQFNNHNIVLITPHAPLGKALINGLVNDVIQLDNKAKQCLSIKAIY